MVLNKRGTNRAQIEKTPPLLVKTAV